MYNEAKIAALSKKQVSKLLNGHPVRVKDGIQHKINLSAEHLKKLHRAGKKGCGITITLDPYAIEHNQHLRGDVGMGGKLGKSFGKFIVKEGLEPLITAGVERGIRGIKTGHGGKLGKSFGKFIVKEGLEPLITAGVQRGIRGIKTGHGAYKDITKMASPLIPSSMRGMVKANMAKYKPTITAARTVGGKVNRLKKFNKWMGALGKTFKSVADYVKPVAKPLLQGATNLALQRMGQPGIPASKPRGRPRRAARAPAPVVMPIAHYPSMSELDSGNDLGLPPLPEDINYVIPYGKAYASGLKKKKIPKADRPKRVMSEAQKAALAKGRAALRIKLNEMGAGAKRKTPKRRHTGKSLMPAGY